MRERVKRRLNEALERPRSDDADIPKIMYPSPPGHLQYLADEQTGERHQHKQYYCDGRGYPSSYRTVATSVMWETMVSTAWLALG